MAKSKSITKYPVEVTQEDREYLEKLAWNAGFKWGQRGNVTAWLTAIAEQRLELHAIPPLTEADFKKLPKVSGLYFALNKTGDILYIGKSKNLQAIPGYKATERLVEAGVVGVAIHRLPYTQLDEVQSQLVELLKPPLNDQSQGNISLYTAQTEVEHLLQSFWTLRDTGQDDAARTIANILLERYETSEAVTQHLEAMVNKPQSKAVEQIKLAIANNQPFTLNYQSASGRQHEFNIEYAEINKIERHFYLCCWVDRVTDKAEIPALAHNMTLRLDRISGATIIPDSGKVWRGKLDSIELHFKLIGGWAKGYEAKEGDIESKFMLENEIPVRYVKRRVQFWHWIGRELLRYGAECIVIGPEDARSLIAAEVAKMNQNYQ